MVSCGILTESDKDSITGCSRVEGMNHLIDILTASVRSDGAMFGHFTDILKEEGSDKAKKLAEELIICYRSYLTLTNKEETDQIQEHDSSSHLNDKPQLIDLMNILAEIAHQYNLIGEALKVPDLGLHPLPQYYKENLSAVLKWWLNNGDGVGSPVTYDTIIEAIGGPIVDNYRLAQEITKIKDTRLLTNERTTNISLEEFPSNNVCEPQGSEVRDMLNIGDLDTIGSPIVQSYGLAQEIKDIRNPLTIERTTNISLEEFPSNVLEPGKVQGSEVRDMLNIGDLDDVIVYLKSNQFFATRWQELGLQLGLYKPTLEDIDDNCRGDPRKCQMECLATWLKGEDKVMDKGGPSWTSLIAALKHK